MNLQEPAENISDRMRELIERGSLGTPEAKALRASVSREQVEKVLARAKELESVCHEEVTRKGMLEPCDKPAVAVRDDPEGPYPVCGHHTRATGLVPLSELLRSQP